MQQPIAKRLIGSLIGLALLAAPALAQKGWEAGGWLGTAHYFGDLNTRFDIARPGLAAGGIGRYNFNDRLCLRFGLNYARVMAYDSDSDNAFERTRNLHFRSDIVEGLMQFEVNFLPYVHGSRDEFFTPYLFGGLAVFYFNPQAEYEGDWVSLRPLGTEGQFKGEEYFTIQPALVYGFGFKTDISPYWSINLELSARTLFTDYLDDVSSSYPDMDDLEELRGPLAVALSDRSLGGEGGQVLGQATGRQRGDSSNNDLYALLSVGLVYYFGGVECPSFSRIW